MGWDKVAVVGAGMIKFGELFDQSYEQMAEGAFKAAVASVDKGFDPTDIDAGIVATQRGSLWGQEGVGGNTVASAIGLAGVPFTRVETRALRAPTRFGSAPWSLRQACTQPSW